MELKLGQSWFWARNHYCSVRPDQALQQHLGGIYREGAVSPNHIMNCSCPAVVQAGNEAVLRARFEDAQFFYQADLDKRLEDFR